MSRNSSLQQRQERTGWLFLTPTMLIVAVVGIYPLVQTFWMSLTDARMASGKPLHYTGLKNFADLFQLAPFWQAVCTTIAFTFVSVVLELILGLFIALILSNRSRASGLLRAAILVPWALPTVVSARMWNYMLVDTYGVVNDLLVRKLYLFPENVAWLAQPGTALLSIVAVDV